MAKCPKCHFEYRKDGNCFCVDQASTVHVIQDIKPHYNRGLGMWITSRNQYNQELKSRGLVEVGNEQRYVSPEAQERLKQQKEAVLYEKLSNEANKMLCQGGYEWN